MKRFGKWIGLALSAFLVVNCGGSGGGANGLQVRVVNAIPNLTSADVSVGATIVMTGGSYGSFTGYVTCSSGSSIPVLLTNAGSGGASLVSTTDSFTTNSYYTLYAVGSLTSPSILALQENETAPTSGNALLEFVDTSSTAGNVDVYVTAVGSSIATVSPNISGLQYQQNQSVTLPASQQYVVSFTTAGTKTVVASYTTGALVGGQVPRYVLIDAPTGGAPQSIIAMNDAI